MSHLVAAPFEQAYQRRISESLEFDGQRVTIPIIGLHDLIANKQAAGRHKELEDVEHLLPLLEQLDQNQ